VALSEILVIEILRNGGGVTQRAYENTRGPRRGKKRQKKRLISQIIIIAYRLLSLEKSTEPPEAKA